MNKTVIDITKSIIELNNKTSIIKNIVKLPFFPKSLFIISIIMQIYAFFF